MVRLTKVEEEIMHFIWELDRCTVSDILEKHEEPKPPHSSVSSVVRILEKKGFVDHKAYGRTYEYFPIVTKEEYSAKSISKLIEDYFGGSWNAMVSFLVKEEKVDKEELLKILRDKY